MIAEYSVLSEISLDGILEISSVHSPEAVRDLRRLMRLFLTMSIREWNQEPESGYQVNRCPKYDHYMHELQQKSAGGFFVFERAAVLIRRLVSPGGTSSAVRDLLV